MKREELDAVCAASSIEYVEVGSEHEMGRGFVFHWKNPSKPDDEECVHLSPEALEKVTPAQLVRAAVNGRNVHHVTRIVGYFSHIENWNRSKVGELRDRHKGNYQVQTART